MACFSAAVPICLAFYKPSDWPQPRGPGHPHSQSSPHKARAAAHSFQGNSADVLTRPGGEEQTVKAVALSPRRTGGEGACGGLEKDLSEFKVGVARDGSGAQGYAATAATVAAAASLRGDLAMVFIESLCKSAAESRPAAPAPPNQSMLIYLYGLLQRNSGR